MGVGLRPPLPTLLPMDAGWGILVCGGLPDRKEPFRCRRNVVVAAAGDVVALAGVAAAGGGWNLDFDCYCVEVIAVVASAAVDSDAVAAAAVAPAAD